MNVKSANLPVVHKKLKQIMILLLAFCLLTPFLVACGHAPWDRDYRLRTWEHSRLKAEEYFLKGKPKEAEEMYKQALENAEHIEGSHYYFGVSLLCLAEFYRSNKEYKHAQELYIKALAALTPCRDGSTPTDNKLLVQDIAKAQYGLADTYLFEKKYPQAESLYRQAIASASPWRLNAGSAYTDNLVGQMVALSLYKIAIIFEKTNRQRGSVKYYEKSLLVARNSALLSRYRNRIISDYKNVLTLTGQSIKALTLDADKNWLHYNSRAEHFIEQENWASAQAWEEKALQEAKKSGQDPLHAVTSLNALAYISLAQKEYEKARNYCFSELALIQKLKAKKTQLSLKPEKQSADQFKISNHLSALKLSANELLDLRIVQCHICLAQAWHRSGEMEKAKAEAKKSYQLLLKLDKAKRDSIKEVETLADLLIQLGDYSTAESLINQTIKPFPLGTTANLKYLLRKAVLLKKME